MQILQATVPGLSAVGTVAVQLQPTVSDDLSVSLSRIFAADELFRYNAIYRINDQIILRGSTNIDDESRALIEYESRF